MKKTLLLLALACSCMPALAQNLTEGYVVRNSGDTVRGFIRERVDWFQPYIDFSTTSTSTDLQRIPLSEINTFYLKNYDAYYYARILDIDKKPVDNGKLDRFPARAIVKDTIALRLLVKGAVNLFDYTDENFKQHFFVQKSNTPIEELAYVRYLSASQQIAEMPYFVEPLKKTLADCDKVNINNLRYDRKSLTKAVQQYNSCFGTSAQYGTSKERGKLLLSVFAGGGINKMGFKDEGKIFGPSPATTTWPTTPSVFGGIRFEMLPGRQAIRLIPLVDVLFQKTGDSKVKRQLNTAEDNLVMSFTFVNVDLAVKYMIVKAEAVNVYLKPAASVVYLAGSKSTYTRTDQLVHSTTAPKDFATYDKLGFAYGGGAGISYQRLFFELNYRKNIVPVHSVNANGLCTSFYATVGYRITKD